MFDEDETEIFTENYTLNEEYFGLLVKAARYCMQNEPWDETDQFNREAQAFMELQKRCSQKEIDFVMKFINSAFEFLKHKKFARPLGTDKQQKKEQMMNVIFKALTHFDEPVLCYEPKLSLLQDF